MEDGKTVGTSGDGDGARDAALAAAKQEAATLRDVLEAIQDALTAAAARIEALEAQLAARGAARETRTPVRAPPEAARGTRGAAEWKLPGWAPAPDPEPAGQQAAVTGDTLRGRREALGISQAAVAHAAHCSRGLVAEVERGKRRSAQTLAHLAAVLDRLEQQARRDRPRPGSRR